MKKWLKMATVIRSATALALIALQAQAQSQTQAVVTDPQAVVPAVVYQSVFHESPAGVETQSVDWKKANADVAQFPRGHVDILKWEEAQGKAKPPEKSREKAVGATVGPDSGKAAQPTAATPPAVHKH